MEPGRAQEALPPPGPGDPPPKVKMAPLSSAVGANRFISLSIMVPTIPIMACMFCGSFPRLGEDIPRCKCPGPEGVRFRIEIFEAHAQTSTTETRGAAGG